jgi:RNase H-fold protein (predicted Holliday junction resolvase)
MSIFLGLDISTSNVGITVLDENKLLHASNLSLYKLENQYEKADFKTFQEVVDFVKEEAGVKIPVAKSNK